MAPESAELPHRRQDRHRRKLPLPRTFFSFTLSDSCAATECPTCADSRAAPLFSDWMQAVRIRCHHGDTDWESHVASMATAAKSKRGS